jgi:Integrase zinc binding domain/RNase H-like domain found in reverse transcriptase
MDRGAPGSPAKRQRTAPTRGGRGVGRGLAAPAPAGRGRGVGRGGDAVDEEPQQGEARVELLEEEFGVDVALLKASLEQLGVFTGKGVTYSLILEADRVLEAMEGVHLALGASPYREDLRRVGFALSKAFGSGSANDWWMVTKSEVLDADKDLDVVGFCAKFREKWLGEELAERCQQERDTLHVSAQLTPSQVALRMRTFNNYAGAYKATEAHLKRLFAAACGKALVPSNFASLEWNDLVKQAQDVFDIPGATVKAHPVIAVSSSEPGGEAKSKGPMEPRSAGRTDARCWNCDVKGHMLMECPDFQCRRCSQKGHLSGKCPTNKEPKAYTVPISFVGSGESDRIWVKAHVGGRIMSALVDPGGGCSVIERRLLEGIQWQRSQPRWSAVEGIAKGGEVPIEATAIVDLRVGRAHLLDASFQVVASDRTSVPLLLGADVLGRLGVMRVVRDAILGIGARPESCLDLEDVGPAVAAVASVSDIFEEAYETVEAVKAFDLHCLDDVPEQRDRLRALLLRFRKRFIRKGYLPPLSNMSPVKVNVMGPPVQEAMRPWSQTTTQVLSGFEEDFVRYGHARYVDRSPWRAEPLLVPKANWWRYVSDYKGTNKSLVANAWPMPSMRAEVAKISGGAAFNRWDFADGFRQFRLAPGSEAPSTTRATKGLIEFLSMPQGWLTSPGDFNGGIQREFLSKLTAESRRVTAQYVDDMAQATFLPDRRTSVTHCVDMVEEMLGVAEILKVSFRLAKCQFAVPELKNFCGLHVSNRGKVPQSERGTAIMAFEVENKKDLRALLGMAGDFRAFISRFDLLVFHLNRAVSTKGKLILSVELQDHVDKLKRACVDAMATTEPKTGVPLLVRVDGSGVGFGATLEQEGRLVRAASRVKRGAEFRYSPFDTEWTAIEFGLRQFEYYLAGHVGGIEVGTDAKDLESVAARAFEDRSGRRARIAEFVARIPFVLKWYPRSLMSAPHALSMTPAFREVQEGERQVELRKVLEASDDSKEKVAVAVAAVGVVDVGVSEMLETTAIRKSSEWWLAAQQKYAPCREVLAFKEGLPVDGDVQHLTRVAALAQRTTAVDRVLYFLHKPGSRAGKEEWRKLIWVPDVDNLRMEWFKKAHGQEGGHRKVAKTYARLTESVYWDNMYSDVLKWVEECPVCFATRKFSNNLGGLQPTTSAMLAGHSRVGMDLVGPFEATARGNTMVVVTISYEDGWPTLSALSRQDTESVLYAFRKDTVAQFGIPEVVLTDQGSNLTSEVALEFYRALGIDKRQAAPQSPWTDGAAENMIREVTRCLRAIILELGGNWDEHLWLIELILRSSHRDSIKMSPFEARFGTKMRLPSWFDTPASLGEPTLVAELRDIKNRIFKARDEAAEKMKEYFDRDRSLPNFDVGDLVALPKNDRSHKLEAFKVGPFKIKQKVGDLDVVLEEVDGGPQLGRRPKLQSIRNVERYTPKEILREEEYRVKDIVGHKGSGRGRKYHVVWANGSTSLEPRKNLVDSVNGKETVVEALVQYWKRNPKLSTRV